MTTTTDLDDLQHAWAAMAVRVDRLERTAAAATSRSALGPARIWEAIQLAIWAALLAVLIDFACAHGDAPGLASSAIVLAAYALAVIVVGVVQLGRLAEAGLASPVLVMQRRLAELRRFRARASLGLGLPWWILWAPAVVVIIGWLSGVDLVEHAPAVVLSWIASGVVGLVASVWLARRLAARDQTSPLVTRMIDSLAGRSVARAVRELDELARFADAGEPRRG